MFTEEVFKKELIIFKWTSSPYIKKIKIKTMTKNINITNIIIINP